MSETYACPKCTYEQSIRIPTCELCAEPNPNANPDDFKYEEVEEENLVRPPRVQMPFDFNHFLQNMLIGSRRRDGMITCVHCQYINVGNDVEKCEGCGKDPENRAPEIRLFPYDDYGDEDAPYESSDSEEEATEVDDAEAIPIEEFRDEDELFAFYNQYILLANNEKQHLAIVTFNQLKQMVKDLYEALRDKSGDSNDRLTSEQCQVCCGDDVPLVTMKACGHRIICADDFHGYVHSRIESGEILPWITCPDAYCYVPCHPDNLLNDTKLTYSDLSKFLTNLMLKKLCRNASFLTCSNCDRGGFLQVGESRKEHVKCPLCQKAQTIEKGVHAGLDPEFQKMVTAGTLRECPSCRHLTMKEKGICNIIHCAKCGIWWNWRTKEQGYSERDMKQRARGQGTLWERGELDYQRRLEREKPDEFKALLERNGIKYDPNYRRGQ